MTKSYKESVLDFESKRRDVLIFGTLPIVNGALGHGIIMAGLAISIYSLAFNVLKDLYKDISYCKEFIELNNIYYEVIKILKESIADLKLNTVLEKYAYIRFLIENDYLTINGDSHYSYKIKYNQHAIDGSLSLNGHAKDNSHNKLLVDVMGNYPCIATEVKGYILKEGENHPIDSDTNYQRNPQKIVAKRELSFKELHPLLKKANYYLTAVLDDKLYLLDPNKTQIFTPDSKDKKILLSTTGAIFKSQNKIQIGGFEDFETEEMNKAEFQAMIDETNNNIKGHENLLNYLEEAITPKLEQAEANYKSIIKSIYKKV